MAQLHGPRKPLNQPHLAAKPSTPHHTGALVKFILIAAVWKTSALIYKDQFYFSPITQPRSMLPTTLELRQTPNIMSAAFTGYGYNNKISKLTCFIATPRSWMQTSSLSPSLHLFSLVWPINYFVTLRHSSTIRLHGGGPKSQSRKNRLVDVQQNVTHGRTSPRFSGQAGTSHPHAPQLRYIAEYAADDSESGNISDSHRPEPVQPPNVSPPEITTIERFILRPRPDIAVDPSGYHGMARTIGNMQSIIL